MKRLGTKTTIALVAAFALSCGGSTPPPPLFLFISVDTLGARHTSLHGYERPTTPTLERLATEAVVFERC